MEVVVLTQDACSFCDQAKVILEELAADLPISVRFLNANSHEGERMALVGGILFPPGIFLDGQPFSYGRLSRRKLRRALEAKLTAD